MGKYTLAQFREQFPNDDACLDYLFFKRYGTENGLAGCPHCAVESKFNRVKDRRSYQCPQCTGQVYPTAGTVFEKTTLPLTYWFTAIFMFTTTRNGVAAKELERTFSICYKTALRMAHQVKKLMMDNSNEQLFGEISVDETYLGMKSKNMHAKKRKGLDLIAGENKVGVMVFMEKTGKVKTKVLGVETEPGKPLADIVKENVAQDSTLVTDSYPPYKGLRRHFSKHVRIDHLKGEYAKDGFSTNRNENYNSTLKRMIKGTHIHVSWKHLPKYVAENTFRYVNREQPEKMFRMILDRV